VVGRLSFVTIEFSSAFYRKGTFFFEPAVERIHEFSLGIEDVYNIVMNWERYSVGAAPKELRFSL